ncbi:MAG: hypothetical protein ACXVB7_18455 [Ktedonobacteraceae bacterium]
MHDEKEKRASRDKDFSAIFAVLTTFGQTMTSFMVPYRRMLAAETARLSFSWSHYAAQWGQPLLLITLRGGNGGNAISLTRPDEA